MPIAQGLLLCGAGVLHQQAHGLSFASKILLVINDTEIRTFPLQMLESEQNGGPLVLVEKCKRRGSWECITYSLVYFKML